jgi:hypothetical protein
MRTTLRPKSPNGRYLVIKGDTLWAIAKREYGDPLQWKELVRENRIAAPFQIYIGQELELPSVTVETTDPASFAPKTSLPVSIPLRAPEGFLTRAANSLEVMPVQASHTAIPVGHPTFEFESLVFYIPVVIPSLDYPQIFTPYGGYVKVNMKMKVQKEGVLSSLKISKGAVKFEYGPSAGSALLGVAGNISVDAKELLRGRVIVIPSISLKSETPVGGWELSFKPSVDGQISVSFTVQNQKFKYQGHVAEGSITFELEAKRFEKPRQFESYMRNLYERVGLELGLTLRQPSSKVLVYTVTPLLIALYAGYSLVGRFETVALQLGCPLLGESFTTPPLRFEHKEIL